MSWTILNLLRMEARPGLRCVAGHGRRVTFGTALRPGRPRLHSHRPAGPDRDLPSRADGEDQPDRPGQVGRRWQPCPLRPRCTTASRGRTVLVYRWEAELQAARHHAATPWFQASYRRWRPMVERSIAWLVAGGNRRVRYRGVARNQFSLSLRIAAINLRRLFRLGLTRQHRLGARLRQIAGPGCQCGTSLRRKPSSVTGSHPQHRRFGSDISRAHRSLRPPSSTERCLAQQAPSRASAGGTSDAAVRPWCPEPGRPPDGHRRGVRHSLRQSRPVPYKPLVARAGRTPTMVA
jgi:hypothetical protein